MPAFEKAIIRQLKLYKKKDNLNKSHKIYTDPNTLDLKCTKLELQAETR